MMLALAIAATTATFSVVEGVLLRPLPFHDPGRLVRFLRDHWQKEIQTQQLGFGRPSNAAEAWPKEETFFTTPRL
jgi:hypothetical protein